VAAGVVATCGILFFIPGIYQIEGFPPRSSSLTLSLTSFVVATLMWNWAGRLQDVTSYPVLEILAHRTNHIVWFYSLWSARGIPVVHIFLDDGTHEQLPCKATEVDRVLSLLRALAPQAHWGHSTEAERRYREDPASLRGWTMEHRKMESSPKPGQTGTNSSD